VQVFSLPDGEERIYNIIGYNIHFLQAIVLLNSVKQAIKIYEIALQIMENRRQAEGT
jgi:hypothetical protein